MGAGVATSPHWPGPSRRALRPIAVAQTGRPSREASFPPECLLRSALPRKASALPGAFREVRVIAYADAPPFSSAALPVRAAFRLSARRRTHRPVASSVPSVSGGPASATDGKSHPFRVAQSGFGLWIMRILGIRTAPPGPRFYFEAAPPGTWSRGMPEYRYSSRTCESGRRGPPATSAAKGI